MIHLDVDALNSNPVFEFPPPMTNQGNVDGAAGNDKHQVVAVALFGASYKPDRQIRPLRANVANRVLTGIGLP